MIAEIFPTKIVNLQPVVNQSSISRYKKYLTIGRQARLLCRKIELAVLRKVLLGYHPFPYPNVCKPVRLLPFPLAYAL